MSYSFTSHQRRAIEHVDGNLQLIACAGVIPLALICGAIRGIPFYWRLIDCSFGIFGLIPLTLARKFTLELSTLGAESAV